MSGEANPFIDGGVEDEEKEQSAEKQEELSDKAETRNTREDRNDRTSEVKEKKETFTLNITQWTYIGVLIIFLLIYVFIGKII